MPLEPTHKHVTGMKIGRNILQASPELISIPFAEKRTRARRNKFEKGTASIIATIQQINIIGLVLLGFV